MFITIYKKLPNNTLYLIRFELVNNKFRKWRGKENSVMKSGKWHEFKGTSYQTGKACASVAMFKEINALTEKGYSTYKKRSKKLKTVKPIIRIRKLNMKKIKKLFDEGHKLWYTCYSGVLAVRKTNGCIYNNTSNKRIGNYKWIASTKQKLGYFDGTTFTPFIWSTQSSPKELEFWIDFNKNYKTLLKINGCYYGC